MPIVVHGDWEREGNNDANVDEANTPKTALLGGG